MATRKQAKAFNDGSDARINGLPITANPFGSEDVHSFESWRAGWQDVDRYFGVRAKWDVRQLPPVVGAA